MKTQIFSILLVIMMVLSIFALSACDLGAIQGPEGPQGEQGEPGKDGQDGVGIKDISLVKSTGLVDTYLITYTDGSTSTFTVTNGADGKDGANGEDGKDGVGITSAEVNTDGELVLYFTNGTSINLGKVVGSDGEDGVDGENGKDGVGIASVEIVDGKLIVTLSNGSVIDLGSIKGEDGKDGADGEDGQDGKDLTACDHEFGDWSSLVGATCTSVGIEARACTKCLYTEHNYTEKLNHSYNSSVVAPTCNAQGYTKHICSVCQHTYYDNETDVVEHDYVESHTLESNCEERKVLCICSVCGGSSVISAAPIADHVFGEWIIDIKATCTENGEKYRVCENNPSHIEYQVIYALGHVIVIDEGKDPTCLKKGYTEGQHCAACGEILVEREAIPKLGHEFTSWYTVTPSTETTNGEKHRNCIRCDEFETAEIPMLGHSYTLISVVEPTCDEYGYSLFKCDDCEDTYKDNFVDKIPHTIIDTVIDPTCTNDGYTTHTCSECEYSYITDYVVATGHVYGDWSVSSPAGCETDGEDIAFCCYCEVSTTRNVSATGHLYVLIEVSEGNPTTYKYQCEYCEDTITISNDDDVHIETDEQILNQESSFSFTIVTEEGIEYIYSNLTIIDAYFEGSENANNENVIQEYNVTASNAVENGWIISPKTPYDGGSTYVATITGNIEFADYNGTKLTFSIVDDIHSEATVASNVIFLKNLEDSNPGYYPYEIYDIEESDYLYLILQKIDGINVGDIILIGEVSTAEEIFNIGEEVFFGKVESYYMNDDSEYVCVLSCPELTEVFEKLDISDETLINFDNHPEVQEALEEQSLDYLYNSEEFAKFIVATEQAAMSYAMDRNLRASPLSRESFTDKINIEKPHVEINGTKISLKFSGSFKNEFKNKNGKKVGEFSIDFTINMEFEIKVGVKYEIRYWWFIPTGIEYFDFNITQKDKIAIDFNIKFEVDYSTEEEQKEGRYYYHKTSKKLHVVGCNYEDMTNSSNIVYINEKELHEYKKDSEFSECQKCKPITHLNRSAFVVNTHSTDKNNNVYTIHCYNCWHVENQMNPENMEFFYGSYELLVGKYKLIGQKYEYCSWCNPQKKETIDFEESLLQAYKYADWGEKISQIKEWAAAAGGDEYKDPEGILICNFNYPIYIVTLNLEIRISFNFEFEAALNYHYEQTHENVYGMRLKNGNVTPYSETKKSEADSTLKLSGRIEFSAGLRIDGYVSIVGLSRWVRAGIYVEAGPYIEAKGIVYLTSNPDEQNYAAAYFSSGFYVKSSVYYKLFSLGGEASLLNKKFPISQLGYDKAYFSYTKDIDELEISRDTALDLNTLLAVKYYDIHNEKSVEDVLSLTSNLYTVNIYLRNGQHCQIINGKIIIDSDAPCHFTDIIIIEVDGDTSWKEYVKGSAVFYLDTREIELIYNGDGSHSFRIVDSKESTCTEDGYITRYCDICNTTENEILNSHHNPITTKRIDPTCTTTGLAEGSHCSDCGEIFVSQIVIDVIDHNYVDGTCTMCGKSNVVATPDEYFEFTLLDDETYSIKAKDVSNMPSEVVIPSTYNGKAVTSIGDYAFWNCYSLTSVVIPDSVTSIGDGAFAVCESLVNVNIPDSVTSIGDSAFAHCKSITGVVIPDSVTSIGKYAFRDCTSLTSVVIGNSVTYIGSYAFQYCSSLTTVVIPDSVTSIGDYAFWGCSSLASVVIPNSITSIGNGAFAYCNLDTIVCNSPNYYVDGGCLIEGTKVIAGTNNSTIPDDITVVDDYAFSGRQKLTYIKIPDSVTSIGDYSFWGCSSLVSVVIPDSVTSIGDSALSNCFILTDITVDGNNQYYQSIDGNLYSKDGKTLIQYAIGKEDTSFEIPYSVTTIGEDAFSYCDSLVSIDIPDSVTTIGDSAFYDCDSLTNVVIGDSVTTIGGHAFADCDSLTNVVISDSVISIGYFAFEYCDSFTDVYYTGTKEEWNYISVDNSMNLNLAFATHYYYSESQPTEEGNFWHWVDGAPTVWDVHVHNVVIDSAVEPTCTTTGLTEGSHCSNCGEVIVAQDVVPIIDHNYVDGTCTMCGDTIPTPDEYFEFTLLGDGTYSIKAKDVSNMPSKVVIPSTYGGKVVTSIGYAALYGCYNLTSVVIPDSITSIGSKAFRDCDSLVSVTIPDSVTSIGSEAFRDCDSLVSVTIPDSVTSIGYQAFYDCSSLVNVTIPDSVTSIGSQAFEYCSSLYVVYNNSDLLLEIGSTNNGYVAHYAKILVDNGETIYANDEYNYTLTNDGFLFREKYSKYELIAYIGGEDTVTLPESINGNSYDLYGMHGVVNVIIPKGFTAINSIAFAYCKSLTSVVISDSVTNIGDAAFYYCFSLTSVVIPDSVTSIGNYAFYNCKSLTSVVIPDSVTSIDYGAFAYCSSLTSVVIGDSVTSIGDGAFAYCSNLDTIVCNSPNYYVECGCLIEGTKVIAGTNNSVIPEGITVIDYYAFSGRKQLTSIIIPDSVTSIDKYAFESCSSLTSVVIGDSVTSIGFQAFQYCSSLTSVVIPDSVTSIGNYVFYSCDSLTDVYYTGTEEEWAKITIGSSNACLTNATIHYNYVVE